MAKRSASLAVSVGCLLFVASCAPDISLRHPGSGNIATCEGGYPTGLAGIVRKDLQMRCLDDYQRQGYERITDARSQSVTAAPRVTATPGNINGTFTGEVTGNAGGQPFTMRVTFSLVQSGESAVGVWNTSGGQSGTLTAAIGASGSELRLKQLNPCDGEFVGTAVVEGNGSQLRGSYRGRDCSQSVTASFSVRR
jgi:hypothetical protein